MSADPLGALVPGWEPTADARGGEGPLAGLRIVVKDVIDVAGAVTGAGNPDWAAGHEPAATSAASVAALTGAGATVAGKGQCAELAFSLSGDNVHFGMPANPAAPDRDPGGSTSGPASAVAGGLCELGLGTDTLGSIRVPASYCGVYGFRPTHGRISTDGVMPLAQSFDTVGLLAADPGHLLRAAEVLLRAGAEAASSRPACFWRNPSSPQPRAISPRPPRRSPMTWRVGWAPSSRRHRSSTALPHPRRQ